MTNIKQKRKIIQIITLCIIVVIAVAATVAVFPYIIKLGDEAEQIIFTDKIRSLGVGGMAVMLLLQTAQVVLAIIPGEPIEVIMGVLYGPFGGFFMCTAGMIIGTVIIFCGVSFAGKEFASLFVDVGKFGVFRFISEKESRRDLILFLLFFIPGTPKDILIYFAPFSGITLWRLLLLSTVARIPSVLSSTFVGDRLIAGDISASLIVYAAVAVVSIAGIIIYNKYIQGKERVSDNPKNTDSANKTGKQ